MATLYELAESVEALIDGCMIVDEETGEVLFEPADLDKLRTAYEDKLEACALYVKNLESDAKAIRAEETALAARRRVLERKAESLRAYMLANMEDGAKVSTPRVALSVRNSERVEVTDAELLPDRFVKVERKPSKTDIKKAIKAGEAVEGAEIVTVRNLQVR